MTAFMIASIALFALLSMALSTTSGASWSKRMMVVVYRVENHLRSLMSKRMVTGWSVDADGVSHCHDLMVLDPDRVGAILSTAACKAIVTLLGETGLDSRSTVVLTAAPADSAVKSVYWSVQSSTGDSWTGVTDENGDSVIQAWSPVDTESNFVFADDAMSAVISR